MASKQNPKTKRRAASSVSWLALVAATSLGVAHTETVRAEIKLPREIRAGQGRYRLVVQSYDGLGRASAIPASAQPRGSAQRAVTADDVKKGVRVDLIEMGAVSARDGVVVAWVEPGEPDLEFDGRRARPGPRSYFGVASARPEDREAVEILLDQRHPSA